MPRSDLFSDESILTQANEEAGTKVGLDNNNNSSYSVIVRVRAVLRRTVTVVGD